MIFNKSFYLLMFFALLGGGLLFSETVSVVIVETGIPEGSSAMESSGMWENGIMDTFFEYGHIVSNAPMLRLETEQAAPYPSEQVLKIDQVREGGSAYYVLAVLHYVDGNNSLPSSVSLRLVQLYPNKVLYEVQIDGNDIQAQNEAEYVKKTAETLIPYVKKGNH
jgi:hypothetical protein